jgi:hypothetical protein
MAIDQAKKLTISGSLFFIFCNADAVKNSTFKQSFFVTVAGYLSILLTQIQV